jgi:circadian clock protein KaiC
MSAASDLMSTGILGLDQLLGGGLIRGNSLLIEGPPGSGKSTLALRILYGGAVQYAEPGLLITFEEFPRQVYAESLSCGIDLEALERAGKLRVVWTPPSRILESFRGKSDLVEKIIKELGVRRLLIDSITHFKRVSSDETALREMISGILTHLKIAGVNALLVKEIDRQDDATIAFEEYLADASLRLHNKREGTHGENTRYIEIRKTRGQGHVSGLHPFRLDTAGLRIFPRLRLADVKKDLPPPPPPRGRVAFAVEGLDAMLCGGLLPGSTAVVGGSAGCGKSVLGNHFMDAGLKGGHTGLIVSLKSEPDAILASAGSLGMAWDAAVQRDALRVLSFDPVGLSVEEILDRLVHELRRGRPDRFLFDSVDSLAQIARSQDQLRAQLLAMTGILRTVGTTSIFLQDARCMGGEPDEHLLWLTHLVACSIKFSQAEIDGALRRFVSVVKHAGSDHAKELREIYIDSHGLHVAHASAGLSGILTGQAHRAEKKLSEAILPALTAVDRTLQKIGLNGGATDSLAEDVRAAKQHIRFIDGHLREYLGGVDFAYHTVTALDSPPRQASILLAEDNITNQKVALGILKKLGLSADAVANGAEAITALTARAYDLVLMDIQMPELDGLEATRHIRDPRSAVHNHQVPIIAMTAHAMPGDREQCLAAGMNGYVTKPVAPDVLAAALAKWLPAAGGERAPATVPRPSPPTHPAPVVPNRAPAPARLVEDEGQE